MSKTFGARDRRQRRTRSDSGKHRTIYAGKKVRGKRHRFFPKIKGHKDQIKIWIWQREPMSHDGRLRWGIKARSFLKPEITRFRSVHKVYVTEINSKENIEKFMEENYWAGNFIIMGFSRAKTRTHVKPVKLCKVIIRETSNGFKARMTFNWRLSRYWFWKKE